MSCCRNTLKYTGWTAEEAQHTVQAIFDFLTAYEFMGDQFADMHGLDPIAGWNDIAEMSKNDLAQIRPRLEELAQALKEAIA